MKINPAVNFNYQNKNKNAAFAAKIPEKTYYQYADDIIDNKIYPVSHATLSMLEFLNNDSTDFLLTKDAPDEAEFPRQIDLMNASQLMFVNKNYKNNPEFKKEFLAGLNRQLQRDKTAIPYWISDLDSFEVVNDMFASEDDGQCMSFYLTLANSRILDSMPKEVFKSLSSKVSQMKSPELASVIYRCADINKPFVLESLNNDFDEQTMFKVLMEMPKKSLTLNADSRELLNITLRKLAANTEEISLQDSYQLLQRYADKHCLDYKSEKLLEYIR